MEFQDRPGSQARGRRITARQLRKADALYIISSQRQVSRVLVIITAADGGGVVGRSRYVQNEKSGTTLLSSYLLVENLQLMY